MSKYLFGDPSKESIIEIPQGQLYLVRPLSPKGYSELIFKDAVASIRRTGQEFQYQLVVQRATEEGEEELDDEEGADGVVESLDKDEKTFLLDQGLHFRSQVRDGGAKVLAWRDLSGDPGDLYEFVCDSSIQAEKVNTFEIAAVECQYERKYRRSAQKATEDELREFSFDEEPAIPAASTLPSPISKSQELVPTSKDSAVRMAKDVKSSKKANTALTRVGGPTNAPASRRAPETLEILTQKTAELHLFDFESTTFVLQDPNVVAKVSETGSWRYWLQVTGSEKEWLGQEVLADINPVFNFEYLSFIFNHYTEDGSAYSWLLRFKDQPAIEDFQEGLMRALWEQLNEVKWSKVKDQERDYVFEAFNDMTMDEAPPSDEQEESEEEEEDTSAPRDEQYDTDESEDDVDNLGRDPDGNVNSSLAVGTKDNRSYVIRGSKIGVFKHSPNKHLEFTTNISKVQTPKGKLFSPKKVMLHAQDTNMVMQDEANPNSLYRMDLEYGKIVDEWKVHDDIPVINFAPEDKFAQRTAAQPFLGISRNALFRIDPRVAGNKLVEDQLKQYVSKNDFSAAATTEKGHIAVASNKGDVRLFDRLGVNAKTHIPALGESIIGLDVGADGRYLLATCRTYLLLIDTLQKSGKNEGKLGFERGFAKDDKPQPRRLGLTPSHVAQFQHETGAPLSFTPAKFNTDPSNPNAETSIITSTGPFLVTWAMKKVLAGAKDPYSIKRYSDQVVADNFEFGSDKNVILALPNEVDMVSRRAFKRPTRESIAGRARGSVGMSGEAITPRRSGGVGRRSGLRESVVNSPY